MRLASTSELAVYDYEADLVEAGSTKPDSETRVFIDGLDEGWVIPSPFLMRGPRALDPLAVIEGHQISYSAADIDIDVPSFLRQPRYQPTEGPAVRVQPGEDETKPLVNPKPVSGDQLISRRDLFKQVSTLVPETKVQTSEFSTSDEDVEEQRPIEDDVVLDLTRGQLIVQLARRHVKDNGRLPSQPFLERILRLDTAHCSLLSDPEFKKLFNNYGAAREKFLSVMQAWQDHPRFAKVLASPLRSDYLREHRAEDLLNEGRGHEE